MGRNGHGLIMSRKQIFELLPHLAPRSHANTYRLSLLSTPNTSGRTLPSFLSHNLTPLEVMATIVGNFVALLNFINQKQTWQQDLKLGFVRHDSETNYFLSQLISYL